MIPLATLPCIVKLSDSHRTHPGCVGVVAYGAPAPCWLAVWLPNVWPAVFADRGTLRPGPWAPTPERIIALERIIASRLTVAQRVC